MSLKEPDVTWEIQGWAHELIAAPAASTDSCMTIMRVELRTLAPPGATMFLRLRDDILKPDAVTLQAQFGSTPILYNEQIKPV